MRIGNNKINWKKLWKCVIDQFVLGDDSIHGWQHWEKVEKYGLTIAKRSGADRNIVRLFAVLHDSRRKHDGIDAEHGYRSAEFAISLRDKYFKLNENDFTTLIYAIKWHNKGLISDDPTIGTCWDADRLDLPRAGIFPRLRKLNTEYGKSLAIELREMKK